MRCENDEGVVRRVAAATRMGCSLSVAFAPSLPATSASSRATSFLLRHRVCNPLRRCRRVARCPIPSVCPPSPSPSPSPSPCGAPGTASPSSHTPIRRTLPRASDNIPGSPAPLPSGGGGGGSDKEEGQREWLEALEGLLVEALRTYYQGTPLFSEAEFNTLRDELDHLGLAQVRLHAMEKIWMQATSSRDLDRRIRQEFDLSEDDLASLKNRLLVQGFAARPTADGPPKPRASNSSSTSHSSSSSQQQQQQQQWRQQQQQRNVGKADIEAEGALPPAERFLGDAEEIRAKDDVNERIRWFLFSDASEERFKIMLLYLPAVVMSFVTASVLTILFALLDGEMQINVTAAGRFRLGILSYVVVALTFWFSNQVTPVMLDYLDLGQPSLMRGSCPICGAAVSCLFTGAARVRDERKCSVCGATVGFNRRWAKTYLVSPPGQPVQSPD